MELRFVDVKTITHPDNTDEIRVVSLAYAGNLNPEYAQLLGGINHGSLIIIDQELVDDLQKIVNFLKENKYA
mgnify:CR=1 FL=1